MGAFDSWCSFLQNWRYLDVQAFTKRSLYISHVLERYSRTLDLLSKEFDGSFHCFSNSTSVLAATRLFYCWRNKFHCSLVSNCRLHFDMMFLWMCHVHSMCDEDGNILSIAAISDSSRSVTITVGRVSGVRMVARFDSALMLWFCFSSFKKQKPTENWLERLVIPTMWSKGSRYLLVLCSP